MGCTPSPVTPDTRTAALSRAALGRRLRLLGAALCVGLLAACASPGHRAPVEDRQVKSRPGAVAQAPAAGATASGVGGSGSGAVASPVPGESATRPPPPGIENLGKPGYYQVKPGDTLIRIGLETGQSWRDIARWNNLENANLIESGQVLRVVPPGQDAAVASTRPVGPSAVTNGVPATAPGAVAMPAPGTAPTGASPSPVTSPVTPPVAGAPAATAPATASPPAASAPRPATAAGGTSGGDEDIPWMWPASGPVLQGFDDARSKGLAIGGRAGDPVVAAADGRVVYAGSGLRGYGNLVIIKHNNTFLTAYAHNQSLLVREDQTVRRGQRIAEMGSTDADRVQLHFEIRRQGRPIDPARLLPSR